VRLPDPTTMALSKNPRGSDSLARALGVALGTTAVVTAISWLAPAAHAATAIAVVLLAATWWRVLRFDVAAVRAHGLSLGGLLEPAHLDARRLLRDMARAIQWAGLVALITFPPFFYGFEFYYKPAAGFSLALSGGLLDELSGQLFVIALPEEAFFRGYLQTRLDQRWPPRWRVLGASLGPGWLITAGIFAVGHVLTTPNPGRLAVFFPALVFGWLRARTGGVGAGVAYHAACNVFSATLARGFGLS
jgi:membrane protease YdiL (CAAX protease family)